MDAAYYNHILWWKDIKFAAMPINAFFIGRTWILDPVRAIGAGRPAALPDRFRSHIYQVLFCLLIQTHSLLPAYVLPILALCVGLSKY